MLYKCYRCGKEYERSERAIKYRPIVLCKACQLKEAYANCDKKACIEKRKKTCLKKYGTDNPAKAKKIKDKTAKTCIEKYGVKSPLCLDENKKSINLKERGQHIKKTMQEKYGGCTYSSKELNSKAQKTCMEKYGQPVFAGSDIWRQKREETLIRVYGSLEKAYEIIIGKSKATCLELYGCENPGFLAIYHKHKINYDGLVFDSMPEVEFYKFFKSKGISIERNVDPLEYFINGKVHKYFPDFRIGDNLYEIKGDHLIDNDGYLIDFYGDGKRLIEKTNCMRDNNVILILASQLQQFFDNFKASDEEK